MSAVVRTRLAALLIVAVLHPAGEAAAQGGAYRGPRGVAPDSIRDWRRSRPPPPPPPASVPEGGPSRRSEGIGPDDWTFWYHHENEPFEELKDALYHRVGSSPLQAFGAPHDPTHGTTADIRTLVRTRVAPVLAQMILDPATDPRLRRAASLALGKTSTKTAHVALLLEALAPSTSRPDAPSWESALALGLLRR
ncbi:MAG: hypothetical protein QNJ98_16150, partial [Planctomycetota bacterium]|nr:hypothetical protein [Planctomycetota bacterium]